METSIKSLQESKKEDLSEPESEKYDLSEPEIDGITFSRKYEGQLKYLMQDVDIPLIINNKISVEEGFILKNPKFDGNGTYPTEFECPICKEHAKCNQTWWKCDSCSYIGDIMDLTKYSLNMTEKGAFGFIKNIIKLQSPDIEDVKTVGTYSTKIVNGSKKNFMIRYENKPEPYTIGSLYLLYSKNVDTWIDQEGLPILSIRDEEKIKHLYYSDIEMQAHVTRTINEITGKPLGNDKREEFKLVITDNAIKKGKICNPKPRVNQEKETIYYDLTNDLWECVKITKDGWEIINPEKPHFKRTRRQGQQPKPERITKEEQEEVWEKFFKILNIDEYEQKTLIKVWITTLLLKIEKPSLLVLGPEGSGKTIFQSMIKQLIDPTTEDLAKESIFPDKIEDLKLNLANTFLPLYGNITKLSEEQQDILSAVMTGASVEKRKLYTDSQESTYQIERPIMFNTIKHPITRNDLLDRIRTIELQRMTENRIDKLILKKELDEIKPKLLGTIFDAIIHVLNNPPKKSGKKLTRMASFDSYGDIINQYYGGQEGEFIKIDNQLTEETKEDIADSSTYVQIIEKIVEMGKVERGLTPDNSPSLDEDGIIVYSPTNLYNIMKKEYLRETNSEDEKDKMKYFPSNPVKLSESLKMVTSLLETKNIIIRKERAINTKRNRIWVIKYGETHQTSLEDELDILRAKYIE